MTDLEVELKRIMVQLVVRYPDGLERIEAALESVIETGIETNQMSIDLSYEMLLQ